MDLYEVKACGGEVLVQNSEFLVNFERTYLLVLVLDSTLCQVQSHSSVRVSICQPWLI